MSMTDPVADMLTRIRNACAAGHKRVDVPMSRFKTELARLLLDNHYITDFKELERTIGAEIFRQEILKKDLAIDEADIQRNFLFPEVFEKIKEINKQSSIPDRPVAGRRG